MTPPANPDGVIFEIPRHLEYPEITLGELLSISSEKFPHQVCIQSESKKYTFRQVDIITDRIRDGLLALGFKKGDRIALLLPNIPQFVLAFFGIVKMGGVVVAVNPNYQLREIRNMLQQIDANGLFLMRAHLGMLNDLNQTTSVHKFIYTDHNESISLTNIETVTIGNRSKKVTKKEPAGISLNNLLSLSGARLTTEQIIVSPNDPAIFQFSGGTTGVPKAAVGLHKNVIANVFQFRAWLAPIEDSLNPFLVAIPLFHVYGMVLGMVLAILMGCPMILVSDPGKTINIFNAVRHYKPTIFPSVPSLYYALLHSPDLVEYKNDLKSLKVCISGSASLEGKIKHDFESLISGRLVEGYGLSEAPTATHCNPLVGENKVGSIGLSLPDVECRLVSIEDGKHDVREGSLGELIIRGPQVMKEYYSYPAETNIALRDGWLYTGDIAWRDSEGYYFIKGRKKDLIKVGGLQVWPQEVEEVICQIPTVKEIAAAGIPHERLGEVVYVWIVKKDNSDLSEIEVIEHCRKNLARHKVPAVVNFVSDLPRSTVGKILRRELIHSVLNDQERSF